MTRGNRINLLKKGQIEKRYPKTPANGKGRKTLGQYKSDQRAALDAFKKLCGG